MKLAAYLKHHRISYAAFGAKVGSSAPQICRWANDQRRPSLDIVARIHRVTHGHVTAADFLPADLPQPQSSLISHLAA